MITVYKKGLKGQNKFTFNYTILDLKSLIKTFVQNLCQQIDPKCNTFLESYFLVLKDKGWGEIIQFKSFENDLTFYKALINFNYN